MKVDYLYAAATVTDIDASVTFYTKLLGRQPDDRPMETLVQWRGISNAGIQLFRDPARAGDSRMTLVIADVEKACAALEEMGLAPGPVQQGDFGRIAQLNDPDGNTITLAEPPKNHP